MRTFIKRFPKASNCSAFIANTRAGLRVGKVFLPGISGVLHYWSSLILIRKGFKIVGLYPVDLPSNWLSLHPTVRKNGIELMYQRIQPKVRRFAAKNLRGENKLQSLIRYTSGYFNCSNIHSLQSVRKVLFCQILYCIGSL